MKSNQVLGAIIGLLFVVLLAACGASGAGGFPTGKFVRADNDAHGLVFNKDGTFSVFDGSTTLVTGQYSVTSDTFTDESNNQNCPRMTFKFKVAGRNLKFNYVGNPADDPCDGRRGDFNNGTYVASQ